jgi:cell wall-associated NlpC family hydrolase
VTTPAEVIAHARTMLDVPFAHQGRGRTGVDCGGLAALTAKALGLSSFDVAGYARSPSGDSLVQAIIAAGCTPMPMQVGALALLRWDKRYPQHVALVTAYPAGGFALLHAYSVVGKVTEHRIDDKWMRRIVSTWALPGVTYGEAA